MKRAIWSLPILAFLLNLSSVEASRDDTRGDEVKTRPMYLDARERVSIRKSFTWDIVAEQKIPNSLVQSLAVFRDGRDAPNELSFGETVEVLNDGTYLVKELRGRLSISRTPQITAVYSSQELAGITESSPGVFYIGKSDEVSTWSFYYLGATGEVAISVSEPRIAVMSLGRNGIGLPIPTQGPYIGEMCFLGGVSLFRLFDTKLSDWRLILVNEDEWVFELDLSEKIRQHLSHFEGTITDIQEAKFVLDRKRGDAPKRLEIRMNIFTITYQSLEYTSIDGVWFPSVVLKQDSISGSTMYRLVEVSAAPPLVVDIPEGTPVHDYRQLRRDVFKALASDTFDHAAYRAAWSPKLFAEILREISSK